jgi:hypothetical protein
MAILRLLKKGSDPLPNSNLYLLQQGDTLKLGKGSDPFFSNLILATLEDRQTGR